LLTVFKYQSQRNTHHTKSKLRTEEIYGHHLAQVGHFTCNNSVT